MMTIMVEAAEVVAPERGGHLGVAPEDGTAIGTGVQEIGTLEAVMTTRSVSGRNLDKEVVAVTLKGD